MIIINNDNDTAIIMILILRSHLRMQAQAMLRQLHLLAAESVQHGSGHVAVAPVLRMALDAVNSETSLQDTEARMRDIGMDIHRLPTTWPIYASFF